MHPMTDSPRCHAPAPCTQSRNQRMAATEFHVKPIQDDAPDRVEFLPSYWSFNYGACARAFGALLSKASVVAWSHVATAQTRRAALDSWERARGQEGKGTHSSLGGGYGGVMGRVPCALSGQAPTSVFVSCRGVLVRARSQRADAARAAGVHDHLRHHHLQP